jgi:hypothetical protein
MAGDPLYINRKTQPVPDIAAGFEISASEQLIPVLE